MQKPVISADSHITEPPGTNVDRCDRKFRDRAPRMVRDSKLGDTFVVDGMERPVPMGLVAAAGKSAEQLAVGAFQRKYHLTVDLGGHTLRQLVGNRMRVAQG